MQITVDGVKIKPFIFIYFSIACNNIWHSDYDCGRVQMLTVMIGTLSDQCFSQWNAKWDSLLICRLAIVAIQVVIVDRLFGPVIFRAQDQWHFFPISFPICFSFHRVYLNRSCLQFFHQLFRVLRSCQKQWKAWERWKRSWGTLSLSGGKWIWKSCTNHPGTCWENHSSIVKKPEVGLFGWTSEKELDVEGRSVYTHVFFVSFWGGADLNLLRDEVRLYSCTPRNFSVSLREELKRTDAIFWPSCLLVNRCGGNCACCSHRCYDCQCVPARVTKKYHEVNANTSLGDDVSVLPALLKDLQMLELLRFC